MAYGETQSEEVNMLTEPQKALLHFLGDPDGVDLLLSPEEEIKTQIELARLGLIENGKLTEAGKEEFDLLQGQ